MHRILVRPLQAGVRLTAIFDSCHSGTALDLPYIYSTQGVLKEPSLAKEAGQDLLSVISSYGRGDIGGMLKTGLGFFTKATKGEDAHARTLATKTSPADVIMLSGSKDNQTSYVLILPSHLIFLAFPAHQSWLGRGVLGDLGGGSTSGTSPFLVMAASSTASHENSLPMRLSLDVAHCASNAPHPLTIADHNFLDFVFIC